MDTFERYAPFIKDYIFRSGWQELRGVQVAAADVIFNTDDNLILSASTASGKTEAAFFPILTLLDENPSDSIGVLYIGPLKALINDQFTRISELCEEANIPVTSWHGDVSASKKDKLMKKPAGILQITPESLEALLIRKHGLVYSMFSDLRFIIIDEVHSLMRGDRGAQTLCLIERLQRAARVNPRRIGLSATIGDPESVAEIFSRGTGRKTAVPVINSKSAKWQISVEHFYTQGQVHTAPVKPSRDALAEARRALGKSADRICSGENESLYDETGDSLMTLPDSQEESADPGLEYIFKNTAGKKCLVFTNSREECETVTNSLRHICRENNTPERFLIHHGNLATSFRVTAEELMKDDSERLTTVTTSTLELGIDIGRLERAFQIDAPFMVSSFLQRMGRTGRRGLPQQMWFVIREEMPEIRAMLPATIPWKLLQAIAICQTYLEEKWVEPQDTRRMPFSLLFHQTLSVLASEGEMRPKELAEKILPLTPFQNIDKADYKTLLTDMIENDYIEVTEEGGFIVGLSGERIVNNFKFYAVFREDEEYNVKCESIEIGTLVMPPPPGEKIALAGRAWRVLDVDRKRRTVFCEPVGGNVPAYFGQCPGDIKTKVVERMRRVLSEDTVYPYLMKNAALRLAQARATAISSGAAYKKLLYMGGIEWCFLPWLGSFAFLALERLVKIKCADIINPKKVEASRPYYLTFEMKCSPEDFISRLKQAARELTDPMELVYPGEVPVFDKYDEFIPGELIKKGFAYGVLDIDGMKKAVEEL